jgi:hypothetical protein
MPYLNPLVYDSGLSFLIANGSRLDICSAEPANYAGIAAVSLGNKTGLSLTGPADAVGEGREATVPAISDGAVTATGTAAHYVISNGTNAMYAVQALTASQAVTDGNTFTLTELKVKLALAP